MESIRLIEVYVDGYKNLSECLAPFNNFNVLVGPNNSGKSNFVEVFTFVRGLISGSDDFRKAIFERGVAPRGDATICHAHTDICKPITIRFAMEVADESTQTIDVEYTLTVQCRPYWVKEIELPNDKLGFISEQVTYKNKKKTGKAIVLIKRTMGEMHARKSNATFAAQNLEAYSSCLSVTRTIYPKFDGLDANFALIYVSLIRLLTSAQLNLSSSQLRQDLDSGKRSKGYKVVSFDLLGAIADLHENKELFEEFKNTLCQILDFEDITFKTIKVPDKIRKDTKDVPEVFHLFNLKLPHCPYSSMSNYSDGTFLVVALLVTVLSQTKDDVLTLIEEPENSLHPKALKTLISYLKQRSHEKQILITTHSSYLLNNVSPEDVIVARIKENGDTAFEKISNLKELHKRLSRGFVSFGDLLHDDFRDE
ncbi:MAG: hypothetical protein C0399_01215 [Syntrophus sp. (in: bacteria)]|nr:hypothetical protein [Syntrophus sp. (in: bacteria)]